MEILVLKTELDVAQGEYESRDRVFSPEGRFADGSFPGLQLIRPMHICRSLSLKRKKCEKSVTTHMESKLAKSKLLMFTSLWSVVCLRVNRLKSGRNLLGRIDFWA